MNHTTRTALHEAAHAVVGRMVGLEITRIEIDEDSGYCAYKNCTSHFQESVFALAPLALGDADGMRRDFPSLDATVVDIERANIFVLRRSREIQIAAVEMARSLTQGTLYYPFD